MHANDVADSLAHRQVLELVGEKDDRDVVHDALAVHSVGHVDDFERSQVLLGLEGLVRERGVDHHGVEVYVFANLALVERLVNVASLLVSALN